MIVTDERALEAVRPVMFWRLADAPPELRERLGVSPADIEAMRQAMLAGGFAAVAKLIKDDWVRPFVIMGSVAECAAELRELMARLGVEGVPLPTLHQSV